MGKKLSKFDFASFDDGAFAVSAQRYTKAEAEAIFKQETDWHNNTCTYDVTESFVRHRAGYSEETGNVVTWWLEYEKVPRGCPVYVFTPSEQLEDEV